MRINHEKKSRRETRELMTYETETKIGFFGGDFWFLISFFVLMIIQFSCNLSLLFPFFLSLHAYDNLVKWHMMLDSFQQYYWLNENRNIYDSWCFDKRRRTLWSWSWSSFLQELLIKTRTHFDNRITSTYI